MFQARLVALGLAFLGAAVVAQEAGTFPTTMETKIGDEQIKLLRTGTAMRKKGIFKVYLVASYVQEGAKVRTAEELAAADAAKRLHLVFLRPVGGREMAQTFRAVLRQNYPEPTFADEVKQLTDLFERTSAQRGDEVLITHIPKVGLHCRRMNKEEVLIKNVDFSRAVWENYLGKRNVGEGVKQGLVSELPRLSR
jgi:hypothetical protein